MTLYIQETFPTVAVNGIIFDKKKKVLLTLRRDIDLWCIPGGMLECGETVLNAMIRELREEINAESQVIRCTGIYSEPNIKITSPAKGHLIVLAFECSIKGLPKCSDEVAAVEYFPVTRLPSLVTNHEKRIIDAWQNSTLLTIT